MHTDVRLWKGLLFIYLFCREGDYNEFLCHLQGLCDLYQLSRDTWVIYTVINIFFLKISLPIFTCMCCLLHVPLKFSFKNDVESWWFSWVSWYFYFLSSPFCLTLYWNLEFHWKLHSYYYHYYYFNCLIISLFRFQKPKVLAALKAVETDINTMAAFFG